MPNAGQEEHRNPIIPWFLRADYGMLDKSFCTHVVAEKCRSPILCMHHPSSCARIERPNELPLIIELMLLNSCASGDRVATTQLCNHGHHHN